MNHLKQSTQICYNRDEKKKKIDRRCVIFFVKRETENKKEFSFVNF